MTENKDTLRVQTGGTLDDSLQDMARATTIIARVATLTIPDLAAARAATDDLSFLQGVIKSLEQEKAARCRPLRETLEAERAKHDQRIEPVRGAVERIKAVLLQFQVAAQAAARAAAAAEAQAKADLAAAEAKRDATEGGLGETTAAALAETVRTEVLKQQPQDGGFVPRAFQGQAGRASVRRTWTFEVLSLAEVPRDWLVLDEARIRRAIQDGVREIPGIRIFEKESIVGGQVR